jgi:hypothetical protein
MPIQLRPLVESLEGRMLLSALNAPAAEARMLLSALNAPAAPVAETFNFVAPGSKTSGVHAVASQQATSVTLTIQRNNPYHSIQVEVATGPIPTPSTPVGSAQPEVPTISWGQQPPTSVSSAKPGVQYQPVDETITFPPGVTSEPVTIPIVAGAANPGLLSFEVTATQLGVKAGATEDVFLAENINAPVPRIDGVHMVLSGGRVSGFVLHFSVPMDPASVQNRNAYSLQDNTAHVHSGGLFGPWPGISYNTVVRVKRATYDPSTNTVDLRLANSVPAGDGYHIGQNFMGNTAKLLDAAGTPINEDGSGLGGGFSITLDNKQATIFDGVTQSVISATTPPRGAQR